MEEFDDYPIVMGIYFGMVFGRDLWIGILGGACG